MSRKKQKQTSETFILGALLALSGGFQDAYTYNVRDKVFSNAQTGNVVLMSQHFMTGDFAVALQYLFPILAFAGGDFVADRLHQHFQNSRQYSFGGTDNTGKAPSCPPILMLHGSSVPDILPAFRRLLLSLSAPSSPPA